MWSAAETPPVRPPSTSPDSRLDTLSAAALFILIGAEPFTRWLPAEIGRDKWGFVLTGPSQDDPSRLPFESTVPGVFAIGDVRRDSLKRVAAAAAEGAVCVRLVHQYQDDRSIPTPHDHTEPTWVIWPVRL